MSIAVSPYTTKAPSDESRWICIYPVYINAKRALSQGRKIPRDKAVDAPTSQEIHDILVNAGFSVKIEKKMHPKDMDRDMNKQGRVRVQLRNEDGTPKNPEIATRNDVMLHVAALIPKLKSRLGTNAAAATSNAPAASSSTAKPSGKKTKRK